MIRTGVLVLSCLFWGCGQLDQNGMGGAEALDSMAASMAFYASYEDGMDGAFARDDRRVYSAPSYEALAQRGPWYWGEDVQIAYDSGIAGHALSFSGGLDQALFYTAEGNTPWATGGAISLWVRPIEMVGSPVSVAESESRLALSVEFVEESSTIAASVLGGTGQAASSLASEGQWKHLVISFSGAGAVAQIYVDGEEVTSFASDTAVSWEPMGSTIRLGVNYVGLIDELATFDRALTPDEVRLLQRTPNLPASLMR